MYGEMWQGAAKECHSAIFIAVGTGIGAGIIIDGHVLHMFISQSSLFNHIKTLEAELSVPLFERSGKRIIVSEYGQMFLPYAHRIIDATEGFDNEVKEKKMDASRAILIGTQYRLTQLVRDVYKRQVQRNRCSGKGRERCGNVGIRMKACAICFHWGTSPLS